MNDCPNGEIRDLLPDLLHDRLSASERTRVQRHVETCEECSAELDLLRDLRGTLRSAPAIDVAAIAAAIPAYRAPVRRAWGGWRAAAAIAAVVVGGTSVAVLGRGSPRTDVAQGAQTSPRRDSNVTTGGSASVPRVAETGRSAGERRPAPPDATPIAEPQALAMSGGAIGELSDGELATLLDDIESFDAMPSVDVESAGGFAASIPLEDSQ